ncbi:MAG: hypothetical protein J0M33_15210 [Anaerolineae bacterium]|nr:hypothetical protein [Anaerolineae bacterium]
MQLFVEKDTDLMRSTFIAVGVAALYEQLAPAGMGKAVRLVDAGSTYVIDVPYEREQAADYLARRGGRLPTLIPALKKKFSSGDMKELEKDPVSTIRFKYVPQGFPESSVIDYESQQILASENRKQKKGERVEGQTEAVHPDYPVWAHLCSYFGKGSAMRVGYPAVLHGWQAHNGEPAQALLDLIGWLYSNYPNPVAEARQHWKESILPGLEYADYDLLTDVSSMAVISPSTSKGSFSSSVGSKLTENTPEEFWAVIYLAFAGYMLTGMPFTLGTDVLTYYPLPVNIGLSQLRSQMAAYRKSEEGRSLYRYSGLMPRARLDALQHIRYYQGIARHIRENLPEYEGDKRMDSIGGLVGYYYKDIGGTQIPFDETTFARSDWAQGDLGAEQLAAIERLLDAHYELVNSIRGRPPKGDYTSDELTVIHAYRRYITLGGAEDWVAFAIAHTRYWFSHVTERPWLAYPNAQLHIDVFKETLMTLQYDKIDYGPILDTPGFQNIATAIRACTVLARYRKDVKKDSFPFKVRHGLGDDLLRHAHAPADFITDLTTFLHDYARESSSVQADTGETRPFVSDADIGQIVELIALYGSKVVAQLLVATGYASAYRPKAE